MCCRRSRRGGVQRNDGLVAEEGGHPPCAWRVAVMECECESECVEIVHSVPQWGGPKKLAQRPLARLCSGQTKECKKCAVDAIDVQPAEGREVGGLEGVHQGQTEAEGGGGGPWLRVASARPWRRAKASTTRSSAGHALAKVKEVSAPSASASRFPRATCQPAVAPCGGGPLSEMGRRGGRCWVGFSGTQLHKKTRAGKHVQ